MNDVETKDVKALRDVCVKLCERVQELSSMCYLDARIFNDAYDSDLGLCEQATEAIEKVESYIL